MATGYTEGKHNDPASTDDRLVRVGTKYQASAPTVSDGDNAYLLIDSAGRTIVTGPVASDGVSTGSPLPIGGDVDDTSPASAGEGDRRTFRSTPEGNQIVELYINNNSLQPISAMPGASEIKTIRTRAASSTTRSTVLTPTSGKAIRIISIKVNYDHTTGLLIEVYFGTSANIGTNAGKEISESVYDMDNYHTHYASWPDGGGPLGAVDDVLSLRATVAAGNTGIIVHYREE